MKISIRRTALFVFLLFTAGYAQTALNGDAILGRWQGEKNSNVILIYQSNGQYFGKVDHSENASSEGMVILKNFSFNNDTREWDGKVYAPKRDMYFDASIKTINDSTISVTAYAGSRSRSATWKRVK